MRRPLLALTSWITRHPWRVLAGAGAVAILSLVVTSGLEFQSSYLALLPEGAPEVQAIERVRRFVGGGGQLVVAIGGPEEQRLPFARRAVAELRASRWVQWAHVELPVEFFEQRKLLLLDGETRHQLQQLTRAAVAETTARANPMLVDLDEGDDQRDASALLGELRQLARANSGMQAKLRRTVSTPDGRYLLLMVKPAAISSQLAEGARALRAIRQAVERAQGGRPLPVRYAGALLNNQEQHRVMSRDLKLASLVALVLSVGLITFVTRRATSVVVIGAPLALGLLVTLAVATGLIGHLNLVSGFLVAALVGLGIDFGVHLYLRYLDERASAGDATGAMQRAMRGTFGACLTAALTTSGAFLSLLVGSFRGFSEYGLIAGVGVLVTLVVTFFALPPLALLLGPRGGASDRRRRQRLLRTRQLARPLAWAMVAAGLLFAAWSAANIHQVRFENDFRQLKGSSAAAAFDDYVTRAVGGSLSPAVVMLDDLPAARRAERLARAQQRRPGSRIGRVASIASLLPRQPAAGREQLAALRQQLVSVLEDRGAALSTADAEQLRKLLPLTAAQPWSAADVPPAFRERLVTARGGKYLLLVWPNTPMYRDEQIERWAAELQRLERTLAAAGVAATVLDENTIAARVLALIRADAPRVMLGSTVCVLLVLAFYLRRLDRVALVAGAVVVGVIGMLGAMVLGGMSLNLFNAVVLPTVLGIGIDNAIHLQHAYAQSGRGSVPRVVATAGRAALLASATTAIGFGAAVVAHHAGLRQMGTLALVGIAATFIASTVLFPAALRALEGRATARRRPTPARGFTTLRPTAPADSMHD